MNKIFFSENLYLIEHELYDEHVINTGSDEPLVFQVISIDKLQHVNFFLSNCLQFVLIVFQ